ncbi:Syntaxin-71 [Ancistrocladus abbreviatus]
MSVIDILFRVDEICKKYEKYDIDKQRELNATDEDPFSRLYTSVDSEIQAAVHKSEAASMETNRAKVVAMNAEIRRTKARLMEEVPKLQKFAVRKVKGISKEDMIARNDMVFLLADRIKAIPDGSMPEAALKTGGGKGVGINFDNDGEFQSESYEETAESSQFRKEYEMRKMKQEEGLGVISEGLDTLKNLALDMNEELDRQVPLTDEIDTKVDKATSDLKNTNVRLKENLQNIRSSRNFCIDIILLCVILGIASYLYNILK